MDKNMLMRKIQELSFAKDEAILFLDMHKSSKEALDFYREISRELDMLMTEYQGKYGPITHGGALGDVWLWGEGAWPWQNDEGVKG